MSQYLLKVYALFFAHISFRSLKFLGRQSQFFINLLWRLNQQTYLCHLYCMKEILSRLSILFILVLNVRNVVVAYPCRFVVDTVEHIAGLSQVNNRQCVRLQHKVIILEFLCRDKIAELVIKIGQLLRRLFIHYELYFRLLRFTGKNDINHLLVEFAQWPYNVMRCLICDDCREDEIEDEQAHKQTENLEVIGIEHVEVRRLLSQSRGLEGHKKRVKMVMWALG